MENKETKSEEIVEIVAIDEKTSKQGRKYFNVETDKGNFSCFEFDVITELKKHFGKKVQVEIAKNDRGFSNIRKFISAVNTEKVGTPASKEVAREQYIDAKSTTMYVSYAKDIFIEMRKLYGREVADKGIMESCIELVQQAKNAFNECKEVK